MLYNVYVDFFFTSPSLGKFLPATPLLKTLQGQGRGEWEWKQAQPCFVILWSQINSKIFVKISLTLFRYCNFWTAASWQKSVKFVLCYGKSDGILMWILDVVDFTFCSLFRTVLTNI